MMLTYKLGRQIHDNDSFKIMTSGKSRIKLATEILRSANKRANHARSINLTGINQYIR